MIATIIRTVIFYIVVTFAIRIMGKRQVGDMQPNELVVTLLISEIAAIPLQDSNQPILSGVVAIFMLVFLEIIISVLAMKSFLIRKMMSGKSVVIIKNGVIDQQAMRDVRMTVLDLVELLRGQDVFDIDDVAFAVLEVSGNLSVLLKSEAQTVTVKDMKIKKEDEYLPLPVITDGRIVSESLDALSIDKEKVFSLLAEKSLEISDVFMMSMDRYGNTALIRKESNGV